MAWQQPQAKKMGYRRTINVLADGIFYSHTGHSGLTATDVQTGTVVGHHRSAFRMSQNWRWHIAAGDRLLTDGISLWTTPQSEHGFGLLPGKLSLDISGGYAAPTKPAIVDGRLFMRLSDKLVCYDLRKLPPEYDTAPNQTVALTASDVVPGAAPGTADVRLNLRLRGQEIRSIGARGDDWLGTGVEHRLRTWSGRDFHPASTTIAYFGDGTHRPCRPATGLAR